MDTEVRTERAAFTAAEERRAGGRSSPPEPRAGGPLRLSRLVLEDLFGPVEERGFAVRFWNGGSDAPSDGSAAFELVLRHPGALRRALLPPTDATMGRAYVEGSLDLDGDVEAAAALADRVARRVRRPACLARLLLRLVRLPRERPPARTPAPAVPTGAVRHSRRRDARAVRSHYDTGNAFFRLFLDERMVYSCAYFPTGKEDLEEAQEAKLEHICRKLRLQPGERFLDVGCGWGALIVHAAERYGVDALGITLSEPQAAAARERIRAANLEDRCRVRILDYRDLPERSHFDKVASVGMVEHVGRQRLATYFRAVARCMAPGALFLNQGIVSLGRVPGVVGRFLSRLVDDRTTFIQRFVFPDSELVSPGEVIRPGEDEGLELRDVESLREHYARTLRHWVRRLEARKDEALALAGERRYRLWRLYMAASANLFATGRVGIIQALWGRPRPDGSLGLPSARADLYRA